MTKVPMAVTMKTTAFWDVMMYSPVQRAKANMHDVNVHGGMKVQLGSFLTSALDTGWRSASCPGHFTSWGSAPTTN